MKRILLILMCFIFVLFFSGCYVYADDDIEDIYYDQLKITGADEIPNSLSKETNDSLRNVGVSSIGWDEISNLSIEKIFLEVVKISKEKSYKPIVSSALMIAIIILCAMFEGFKTSFGDKNIDKILGAVASLCICGCIVVPIIECINNLSSVISNASNFMVIYVPVIAGIMVSSGQAAAAGGYNFIMITIGSAISQIASRLLTPVLNIILAISIVSAISPKMNLSGISNILNKSIKWILEFIMAIFITFLSFQTIVSTASDNVKTKGMKFAINSFVPIVGGALSDAYTTVYSCLKLLKSSVGAFAVLASCFIFLPPIIECLIWLMSLNICSSISDIFYLKQISAIIKDSSKVISTMLVVLLCVVTILIISTGIILTVGGG